MSETKKLNKLMETNADQLNPSQRIQQSRLIGKLSRKQLSKKIGKPVLWIRYIEEDMPDWKKTISVFELEKLCEALAITAFDVFAPIDVCEKVRLPQKGYLTENA